MQLTEARERIDSLQRRLIEAHDDAKAAVKAKDEALSQLEIVRESHARQAAEIDEMKVINEKIREELNERKDELVQMEAEREQIVSEVKVRLFFFSFICAFLLPVIHAIGYGKRRRFDR